MIRTMLTWFQTTLVLVATVLPCGLAMASGETHSIMIETAGTKVNDLENALASYNSARDSYERGISTLLETLSQKDGKLSKTARGDLYVKLAGLDERICEVYSAIAGTLAGMTRQSDATAAKIKAKTFMRAAGYCYLMAASAYSEANHEMAAVYSVEAARRFERVNQMTL